MNEIKAIIEALVFASDSPLSAERIADILSGTEKADIAEALEGLIKDHETRQSGIILQFVAGGYQFRTRPEFSVWVRKLRTLRPIILSQAALETLAVIAYRQPVVKSDIDRFRGVDSSASLRTLLERKLVRIVGRKDVPGKPIIYGTTRKFLEIFNLEDLSSLPTLRELKELQE
jgi:segregation and condensation protein B